MNTKQRPNWLNYLLVFLLPILGMALGVGTMFLLNLNGTDYGNLIVNLFFLFSVIVLVRLFKYSSEDLGLKVFKEQIQRHVDFEKMETGVNARAIDFAKFGVLYLNGGNWNGTQILPQAWIDESTQPLLPENYSDYYTDYVKAMPGQGYYKYMWWGMAREDGSYNFTAEGDKGQFIYVSTENNMVIVRNGSNMASIPMNGSSCFMNLPASTKQIASK